MAKYVIDDLYNQIEKIRKKKGWSKVELRARLNMKAKKPLFYRQIFWHFKSGQLPSWEQAKIIQETIGLKILH